MNSIFGTMHYRLTILAEYQGVYGFNDVRHRVDEIMDEARAKLAALGYETDVIIRDDDGSTPSPAEAALDAEEARRRRWKEILTVLGGRNDGHAELLKRVRQAATRAE